MNLNRDYHTISRPICLTHLLKESKCKKLVAAGALGVGMYFIPILLLPFVITLSQINWHKFRTISKRKLVMFMEYEEAQKRWRDSRAKVREQSNGADSGGRA